MNEIMNTTETMSSREIAELYGKMHKDVLRKIRTLESAYTEVYGGRSKITPSYYINSQNKEQPEILLNKSQALFVASRFDAVLHARVQKRWEELEANKPLLPDFSNPAESARAWANEFEQKQIALNDAKLKQLQIERDKPKVKFAEGILASKQSIKIGEFAKALSNAEYNVGPIKIFKWMRNQGFLMKNNVPYQRYINSQWLEIQENSYDDADGNTVLYQTCYITPKGQLKISKKIYNSDYFKR